MSERIYCFQPQQKDSERMHYIEEHKVYKYSCWVPESFYSAGDIMVYFNDISEVEPEWLAEYVNKNKKELKSPNEIKVEQLKSNLLNSLDAFRNEIYKQHKYSDKLLVIKSLIESFDPEKYLDLDELKDDIIYYAKEALEDREV